MTDAPTRAVPLSVLDLAPVVSGGSGAEALADSLDLAVDNTLAAPATARPGGDGLGLLGMQERAESLGGTFDARPSSGSWRVRASIPLPPDEGRTP